MSESTKPTMADVSEMVLDYLSHPDNGVGGNLHIVLDDGNTDDGSISFCYGYASAKGDEAGVRLACAMLQLSEAERDALYENRWRVPGSESSEADDMRALAAGRADVPLDLQLLTREDLRAIAKRHAEDGLSARDCPTRAEEAEVCAKMYADRGALLDLLRRLTKAPAVINLPEGGKVCTRCGALSEWMTDGPPKCDPECPAPLLEALR